MKTVYKYPIHIQDFNHLNIVMPAGAEVLMVKEQHGVICIWALVDPDKPDEVYRYRIIGTGHELKEEPGQKYVGSFFMNKGYLVFHVFSYSTQKGK